VLALEHDGAGIYNIVDDEPAPVREWLPVLAEVLGAKPPRHFPRWLARRRGSVPERPLDKEELQVSKLVVNNNLTLDGVMQAPGRPDEDLRGGFEYGGWALPFNDSVMGTAMGERMAQSGALLLGRRTYEDFAGFWPHQKDNPFTEILNNAQKYVASATLEESLPWSNSTLLKGDATEAVPRLKEQPGKDIVVLGSGELVQSLMRRNLVDEYVLLIHPLVLGSGRRLFPDGSSFAALRLVDSVTTTTGVVIATYQPAEPTAAKTT
jgi:dihydrofolate reductase